MTAEPLQRIGIRELRQQASRYIDLVERGSVIEVTRHGRPVARIVRIAESGDPLHDLVADGLIQLADEPRDVLDVHPLPSVGGPTLSGAVVELRDEERG